MKIKVYVKTSGDNKMPEFIDKGEWVDLRKSSESETTTYPEGTYALIPLGVAMRLPKGFEANIVSRSSSFAKYGFIQVNSLGVIDNSYSGDNDEWKDPVYFLKEGTISGDDRICQFRITLSQRATVWQKLKWLFSDGFEFVKVDSLGGKDRGGFGSTGR